MREHILVSSITLFEIYSLKSLGGCPRHICLVEIKTFDYKESESALSAEMPVFISMMTVHYVSLKACLRQSESDWKEEEMEIICKWTKYSDKQKRQHSQLS